MLVMKIVNTGITLDYLLNKLQYIQNRKSNYSSFKSLQTLQNLLPEDLLITHLHQ